MDAYYLEVPMNGTSLWEETENLPILPPTYTRQPGRPRLRSNKEAAEKEKKVEQTPTNPTNNPQGSPQPLKLGRKRQDTLKCTICKHERHNARTHHRHLHPRDKRVTFCTLCGFFKLL